MVRKKVQFRKGSNDPPPMRRRVAHWNSEYRHQHPIPLAVISDTDMNARLWLLDQLLERSLGEKLHGM